MWPVLVATLMIHMLVLFCTATEPAGVSVRHSVSVARGSSVDLRGAIEFTVSATGQCKVVNVVRAGAACGAVRPNIFDCRTYTGPILYQHYGCFAAQELAVFMISIVPSDAEDNLPLHPPPPAHAAIFSVEVNVGAPHPSLAPLKVEASASNDVNGELNLTLVFPTSIVGQGQYEVLSSWPSLSLPLAGSLEGALLNQPLPMGYISRSLLTYRPYDTTLGPYTDYILVKLCLHQQVNKSLEHVFVILPFKTQQTAATDDASAIQSGMAMMQSGMPSGSGDVESQVAELKRDILVIRQAVNTPVLVSDFNSLSSIQNFGSASSSGSAPDTADSLQQELAVSQLIRYTFPILTTGSFHSLYSTANNVSFSSFTSEELQAGQISFHPTDNLSSNNPFLFHYSVTNAVGVAIARGAVNVLARERIWDWPTQRRNIPLMVTEGGTAIINGSTLDFYLLKSKGCNVHATLRALHPPMHGELLYENGSAVHHDEVLIWTMRNTSLLRYRHSGGEELADMVVWEVVCRPHQDSPVLQVFMSILVAPLDDAPPTLSITTRLQARQGWGVPLNPSLLQAKDPDSPMTNISFTVSRVVQGFLLRTVKDIVEFENSSLVFPLVSKDSLSQTIERAEMYEDRTFTLADLEQQKVWFLPFDDYEQDRIEMTVSDSINQGAEIYTLHIVVSPSPPNQTLWLSTFTQYPYILKNKPLPLIEKGHMYLTPYFLYSQAPPHPSKNVKYVITIPPTHGHLCSLPPAPCQESRTTFTQEDIDYHRLIYQPKIGARPLLPDNFSFILTVEGIPCKDTTTYKFNWTLTQQDLVTTEELFTVRLGRRRRISTKFLKVFETLLDTDNITFLITEAPRYGNIDLRNKTHLFSSRVSSFTYSDAIERLLWYTHTQTLLDPTMCSDQLLFTASSPHSQVRGKLLVIFKNGTSDLSVTIQPRTLMGQTSFFFTKKDFAVQSSVCSKYVTFTVKSPPSRGHLNLKDHLHKTERRLVVGSQFTAKDVYSNALSYSISFNDQLTANISDGFMLNVSDPQSTWPPAPEVSDRIALPNLGHFMVFIVLSPTENYTLQVNISTRQPVTWLPARQSYGYTLTSSDIDLLNSTLQLHQVTIQLEGSPILGYFAIRDMPTSLFTAADIQAGSIMYIKNFIFLNDVYQDSVELGVYADINGIARRVAVHEFTMEWAVVSFEQSAIEVTETQRFTQVTVRYVVTTLDVCSQCVCEWSPLVIVVCYNSCIESYYALWCNALSTASHWGIEGRPCETVL